MIRLQKFIFSAFFLALLSPSSHGSFGADECMTMGFTPELVCDACEKLSEFDLDEIKQNCLQCCKQQDNNETVKKYFRAVLEVCGGKLGRYPQVQAFIKSERPKAFPNLSIKYVRGKDPTVLLLDEDNQVQETLSVEKWDTDNIEEFFTEKLQ